MFDGFKKFFAAILRIGVGFAPDEKSAKLVRVLNWGIIFSILFASIQIGVFWNKNIYFPIYVALFSIVGYLASLMLHALGAYRVAPVLFSLVAASTIAAQHFYFGFQAGFWLLLVNLAQAIFIIFPNLYLRSHLFISIIFSSGIITLVLLTKEMPPFYSAVTPELSESFLKGNILRSSILFVLVGLYLVYESSRTERRLLYAVKKATEAAEAKSFFLSNISHELRTPMNAIKGFADILLDATNSITNEKQRFEFRTRLQQIEISAANLTTLINDLLDYTRIEARTLVLHKQDFDLIATCENLMQTAQFYGHRSTGITTQLFFASNVPRFVYGDSTRVSQILLNLLGNAMKFTHRGGVTLNVMVSEQDENGYRICFEVEDTGIGIPKEKLPYLFERFSPVSRETAVRYGGTGLGLAISKQLVELQGGKISVMSSPGDGTVFLVDLPFEKAKEKYVEIEHTKYDLNGKKILVAEDNEVNQLLVKTLLEAWNSHVTIVDNGLKAFGSVNQGEYDLVLMDLQMPFMDGFEAAEQIRAIDDPKKSTVPIVALTADVLSETRQKVFQVGMNNIVTKPINQAELYRTIQNALIEKPDENASTQ
ncbi:MAG: Sensor histidine kinase RcsC [Turneriella sp.]|nr:Sensor histidine kinase RcsC [Turneriella sp.]